MANYIGKELFSEETIYTPKDLPNNDKTTNRLRTNSSPREEDMGFAQQLLNELSKNENALEDGRITKAYFDRLKMIEYGWFVLSLIGMTISIMQYDLEFHEIDKDWSYWLLWIIFSSSIMLSIVTIIKEVFKLDYAKTRKLVPKEETLFTTGNWKILTLKVIFCMIGPSPFLMDGFPQWKSALKRIQYAIKQIKEPISYHNYYIGIRIYFYTIYDNLIVYLHVNEILNLFLFLRIFPMFRVLLLKSQYSSNRSQRICEMYACHAGNMFTIKCLMKEIPFTSIVTAMLISIPTFAYIIRICENPISRLDNQPFYFDSFYNCLWNTVVTITTVGYGDYYVRTLLGRSVIFFVCIWGVFIVSIMVVTLTDALNMTSLEAKAYLIFQKLNYKDEMRKEAASIITSLVKAKLMSRKEKNKLSFKNFLPKLRYHMKSFRRMSRLYREDSEETNGFEEMHRQFEFLRDNFKDLQKHNKYLIESNRLIMNNLGVSDDVLEKLNNLLKNSQADKKKSQQQLSTLNESQKQDEDEEEFEKLDISNDYNIKKEEPYQTDKSESQMGNLLVIKYIKGMSK